MSETKTGQRPFATLKRLLAYVKPYRGRIAVSMAASICVAGSDAAIAKLYCTEALAFISDEALQIHGGMGLMADLPLERIWRDHRVERIWEGTSEVQRLIISRSILRPLEQANKV